MVIIQLAGGLGNQMFQYALYLQLKSLGKDVRIDDIAGFAEDRQRVPALAPFGVKYERADRKELQKMLDSSPLLHARIRRKLCGRKKKSYFEAEKRYMPQILEWDDIYLEGYWQTEKYFQAVAGQVREVYDTEKLIDYIEGQTRQIAEETPVPVGKRVHKITREPYAPAGRQIQTSRNSAFSEHNSRTFRDWLQRIGVTESVSVHIRRGDYLLPENQELFGGICTEDYYDRTMGQMRKEHPGCVFYLFTNDKQWAEKWVESRQSSEDGRKDTAEGAGAGHIEIVELTDIPDSEMDRDYAEFVLMSRCRHNILANSSFSWWASYLNQNPHKTVYAPEKWLNGWDCRDVYRADMTRIPG